MARLRNNINFTDEYVTTSRRPNEQITPRRFNYNSCLFYKLFCTTIVLAEAYEDGSSKTQTETTGKLYRI